MSLSVSLATVGESCDEDSNEDEGDEVALVGGGSKGKRKKKRKTKGMYTHCKLIMALFITC